MKILLIIEILIFFIRWFLGNCIKDDLELILSKWNDVYAILTIVFGILLVVILIKGVIMIF